MSSRTSIADAERMKSKETEVETGIEDSAGGPLSDTVALLAEKWDFQGLQSPSQESGKETGRDNRGQGNQRHPVGIAHLPNELAIEILSYLLPIDIIAFFRSNKLFVLLWADMPRVWGRAMQNVPELPPCPNSLNDKSYLLLLFSQTCSTCGVSVSVEMDPYSMSRLCESCSNTPVNKSAPEVNPEQARAVSVFIQKEHFAREKEKKKKIALFQSEVNHRLMNMNWTRETMEFGPWSIPHSKSAFDELTSRPESLTDEIWKDIEPKITVLLRNNYEARVLEENKKARKASLLELLAGLESQVSPKLRFKFHHPLSSTLGYVSSSPYRPFPDIATMLDWPIIKDLLETDYPVKEIIILFEKNQEAIQNLVAEWKHRIESRFANLVRHGRGSHVSGDSLQSTWLEPEKGSDPFADLTDDHKLLLRADALFYDTSSVFPNLLLTYGTILHQERLSGSSTSSSNSALPQSLLYFDQYRVCPEVQAMARALMASMQIPNASYLELSAIGAGFRCERCHELPFATWEQLVQHFTATSNIFKEMHSGLSGASDGGITYRNVHDPTLQIDRPLVGYYSIDSREKVGEMREVIAPEWAILRHTVDVHGIAEPIVNEHYSYQRTWGYTTDYGTQTYSLIPMDIPFF
ncbi:unnamed protein product [Rhizoctonia solani]|uniref:F-box domain-containing protein n=1 Tax=Rhizoctonia solani TaxID=456999 RepID=A0A8H2XVR5_9AGAM|nr:unnamed protein product [Rhizoctonia solani]